MLYKVVLSFASHSRSQCSTFMWWLFKVALCFESCEWTTLSVVNGYLYFQFKKLQYGIGKFDKKKIKRRHYWAEKPAKIIWLHHLIIVKCTDYTCIGVVTLILTHTHTKNKTFLQLKKQAIKTFKRIGLFSYYGWTSLKVIQTLGSGAPKG